MAFYAIDADRVQMLAVYSDRDRARAGVIVTIGDDGEFCPHQGLVERRAAHFAGLAVFRTGPRCHV
jgi:hypothetical protein